MREARDEFKREAFFSCRPECAVRRSWALDRVFKKIDHARFVFCGRSAERGGVFGAFDDPQLFLADRSRIDAFGVAAGNAVVARAANQKNREGAGGDGFFR